MFHIARYSGVCLVEPRKRTQYVRIEFRNYSEAGATSLQHAQRLAGASEVVFLSPHLPLVFMLAQVLLFMLFVVLADDSRLVNSERSKLIVHIMK
jgi:hypothetical protein